MVDRINSCPSCGAEISIGDTRCNYCSSEFKSEVSTGKIDLKSRLCPFCKFNADLDEEYWQRTKDKAQLIYIDGSGNRAKIEL